MPAFNWVARYRDGSSLYQKDPETGVESASEHIDRSRVHALELRREDGAPHVVQHFEPGQRLIYRRRTAMNAVTGEQFIVHLLGRQETIEGQNVQHISVVFENDGHIECIGRFDEKHAWFYPPQPVPADAQLITSAPSAE